MTEDRSAISYRFAANQGSWPTPNRSLTQMKLWVNSLKKTENGTNRTTNILFESHGNTYHKSRRTIGVELMFSRPSWSWIDSKTVPIERCERIWSQNDSHGIIFGNEFHNIFLYIITIHRDNRRRLSFYLRFNSAHHARRKRKLIHIRKDKAALCVSVWVWVSVFCVGLCSGNKIQIFKQKKSKSLRLRRSAYLTKSMQLKLANAFILFSIVA